MKADSIPLRAGLILLAALSLCSAGLLPLDHPAYEAIDYLSSQGLLPGLAGTPKPFDSRDLRPALKRLDSLSLSAPQRERAAELKAYLAEESKRTRDYSLLLCVQEEASAMWEDTLGYHTRHSGGAAFQYGRFALVNRVASDITSETNRYDHLERSFKGKLSTDVPQSYLAWTGDKFGLLLGRNSVHWGPGRYGSLLLGNHQPPLNMAHGWTRLGFLEGHALSCRLVPINGSNRYFSASRAVIRLKPNLSLSFNQSVVYTGPGRDFEPQYVFPSFVYYFSQFGFSKTNRTDNIFVGADVDWRVLNQYRVYAEFLADDFQVDRDPVSRGVQNAVAFLAGFESGRIFSDRVTGGFEAAHANSYVYKHLGGLPSHYIANLHGGTLGHPMGPDAQQLDAWIKYRFAGHVRAGLDYRLVRRGDLSSLYGAWDAYAKAGEAVPHGLVENTQQIMVNGGWVHWKGLSVTGEAGIAVVSNRDNRPGDETDFRAGARLLYHWDRLIQWNERPTFF